MKEIIAYGISKKILNAASHSSGEIKAAFLLAYEMLKTEPEIKDGTNPFDLLDILLNCEVDVFSDNEIDLVKRISATHYQERLQKEWENMSYPGRLAIRLVIEFVSAENPYEPCSDSVTDFDVDFSDLHQVGPRLDEMVDNRLGDRVC